MFIAIPMDYKTSASRRAVPAANIALIAINVLLFALGWCWAFAPGRGVLGVVTYGFSHFSCWHLLLNMWVLWVFGNPVNRRLGNGYYLAVYLGTIMVLGLLRLILGVSLVGSSGAILAVMVIALILIPTGVVEFAYLAIFPLTVLMGLLRKPKYGLNWFLAWGMVSVRALPCLVVFPLLELWSLFWCGWNWVNLTHLFGMICGLAVVLMLPTRLTMPGRAPFE